MKNSWNKFIYKLWSPFYDKIFNSGFFLQARKKVFENLPITNGLKILFVGVGTGADIQFINQKGIEITGIDLSKDMINQAKKNFAYEDHISFIEMDAQNLLFPDESFDIVVANLIVSVVPNPEKCLEEILRVCKTEGTVLIFDKFVPKDQNLSLGKKMIRPLIAMLGTDIGVSFERIMNSHKKSIEILEDIPLLFNGMYRKITFTKKINSI